MTRKRFIMAAILGIAIASGAAAAPCTPAGVIRQRFVDDGASAQVVADPRGLAVVRGAILVSNLPSATDAPAYLVVEIARIVLVYQIDGCGQICASGDKLVQIRGRLAAHLIRRLREVEGTN